MTINLIDEEAARWLSRQQDDAMDWDGFMLWLNADPRHRSAYDELALLDRRLDEQSGVISELMTANDLRQKEPSRHVPWPRWTALGGGTIAAGIAALLWLQPAGNEIATRTYQSAPGKMVRIAFDDGTRILLAPASRVAIRGAHIDLEGSAYFEVPHRPRRALSIGMGDFQVTDIGTRFSAENEPGAVSVEVAEGSVAVSSARLKTPVSLSTGHGFLANKSRGAVRLTRVDPQQVGLWRTGKLQFDNASLALVAREISRYSATRVTVDPTIANEPFSGVIAINHGEAPVQTLAQILSLEVEPMDGALRLRPRRR